MQYIQQPELEMPPVIAGLPREYLLQAPRPVLFKDFFEAKFVISLRVRERIKLASLGLALNSHDVPV